MTTVVSVQFSTSTAWQSSVIRRLCHSPFSHVDIILPAEGLMGVSGLDHSIDDPGGVLVRKFNCWPYLHPPIVAKLAMADDVAKKVTEIGRLELGKPFDNSALWDFLSDKPGDRDWHDTKAWFCSEFVAYCLETAGFFPYTLIAAKNRITPADLLLIINPFLTEVNIGEFRPAAVGA